MLKCVCLSSGGLDSLVCMALLKRQQIEFLPLFVDYGQRNKAHEYGALERGCAALSLRAPVVVDVHGFGSFVPSGLTDPTLDVVSDAFTPNRNLLFILLAASLGYQKGASRIVLGFLSEATALFPDQTDGFIEDAQRAISRSLGVDIEIVLPLRSMRKSEVVTLARELGITQHYSCHSGGDEPCGRCIACLEYNFGGE